MIEVLGSINQVNAKDNQIIQELKDHITYLRTNTSKTVSASAFFNPTAATAMVNDEEKMEDVEEVQASP